MISRFGIGVAATAALVVLLSCVTINVYFPAAAIKDLSRAIEEQVQKEAAQQAAGQDADGTTAQPAQEPPPGGESPDRQAPKGGSGAPVAALPATAGLVDSLLGVTPALAQEAVPPPEISNPAIRKIIESRAARVAQLDGYKFKGLIGENNQALVEARELESVPDLKTRAEIQRLVKAENADREELYKEIAAAKNVDLSQLPKIRETYASTLRENARLGDWIQTPEGEWKRK